MERSKRMLRGAAAGGVVAVLSAAPALAQFSAQDGSAPDGSARAQVELTPYLWLPATTGTASLSGRLDRTFDFDSGPPSPADLAHSLHGAFMGFGLLRYGAWSAELDIQWLDAFHKSTVQLGATGLSGTLKDTATVFRIAPGFGYQVYSGELAGVPTTVDTRVGFSVLDASAPDRGTTHVHISAECSRASL